MLPAVGQGIIAVQCRKNDKLIFDIIKKINDKKLVFVQKLKEKCFKQ